MRDSKSAGLVTPKPYYKIAIGCSNRRFYGEKCHLHEIAESVGIEIDDGYVAEKCDYEGDLELIVIYRQDRAEKFINAVLDSYGVDVGDVPNDADIHVSIF